MIYCGLLRHFEARRWAHWWNIRGHHASLEAANWRGYFHCYLRLNSQAAQSERRTK